MVKQFLDCFTLEYGTDRLSQNVSKEQPFYTTSNPKSVHISLTSQQKPEILHIYDVLIVSQEL